MLTDVSIEKATHLLFSLCLLSDTHQ